MKTLDNGLIIYRIPQENILIRLKNSFLPVQEQYLGYISRFINIPKKTKSKIRFGTNSTIKKIKYHLLNFQRYFYNPNAKYADDLIKKWIKSSVRFFMDLLLNGFVFWLTSIGLTSIFTITWIQLGPGFLHILNIFELGLILWFFEGIYKYIRGGYKK